MQWAYHFLALVKAEDCDVLKEEILACCGLSPTWAISEFHQWSYKPGQEARMQMDKLLQITLRWLQPVKLTPTEIVEWVTLDHFLQGLPGEE